MSAARATHSRRSESDTLQRGIAGASLLLVLLIFLYLGWQAFVQQPMPPRISVEVVYVDRSASPVRVSFIARNSGTRAAASVQVEGAVLLEDEVVESAMAVLDYVPGGATRQGVLLFLAPFNRDQLRVRAVGHVDP